MRTFPKPENASLTLIQGRGLCIEAKIENPHKVVEKLRLGVFLSRPSGFESTRLKTIMVYVLDPNLQTNFWLRSFVDGTLSLNKA